ncbi:type II toxin-antitoxin system VapB family antitoxin [Thiothrix lacustris]|uniref:type II toxin-antitoxin system VapB family antitoxin n=1 Tax=Thiothrix lacustris TaxID=525917 RepID=UPI00056E25CE|nr:type II toxin-antitoxin system VapB family antitoxin [Thiothrix lacustris]
MYAVEFESFIKGNTLEIPAHLLQRISKNRQVKKVIMLMPKKTETAQATSQTALKERLLTIAKRYAALPLLDRRTPDEILGYDKYGMPSA